MNHKTRLDILLTERGMALRDEALSVPSHVSTCVNLSQEESVTLYNLLYKILGNLGGEE